MTVAQHKGTAQNFFERLSASDIDGALTLLSDDATWWILGKPDIHPAAATYNKAEFGQLFQRMLRRLEHGLQMTVKGMFGEGDKLSVELESLGTLKNGRVYNQLYHQVLEFKDGKIVAAREYLDTQHSFEVWFRE
jgi:uncharacterized protein